MMFKNIEEMKKALLDTIRFSGAMNVKNEYLHKLYAQVSKQV